jgi:hypothetical protein
MAKSKTHYVDNAKFLQVLVDWRAACHRAALKKQPPPPVPEYIGETFLAIATHLSFKPNFVNYTFRDDMISDGIENCLVYIHRFDPAKSNNPFGYFTQIIYYAFIRRIQREKKHTYIKYKLMEQQAIEGGAHMLTGDGDTVLGTQPDSGMLKFDNVQDFIRRFDSYTSNRRQRRRRTREKGTLE